MSDIIRGIIDVPYGRRGVDGPTSAIIGDILFTKCECGKYIDIKTNEHIEVEIFSLQELLKEIKCPDNK